VIIFLKYFPAIKKTGRYLPVLLFLLCIFFIFSLQPAATGAEEGGKYANGAADGTTYREHAGRPGKSDFQQGANVAADGAASQTSEPAAGLRAGEGATGAAANVAPETSSGNVRVTFSVIDQETGDSTFPTDNKESELKFSPKAHKVLVDAIIFSVRLQKGVLDDREALEAVKQLVVDAEKIILPGSGVDPAMKLMVKDKVDVVLYQVVRQISMLGEEGVRWVQINKKTSREEKQEIKRDESNTVGEIKNQVVQEKIKNIEKWTEELGQLQGTVFEDTLGRLEREVIVKIPGKKSGQNTLRVSKKVLQVLDDNGFKLELLTKDASLKFAPIALSFLQETPEGVFDRNLGEAPGQVSEVIPKTYDIRDILQSPEYSGVQFCLSVLPAEEMDGAQELHGLQQEELSRISSVIKLGFELVETDTGASVPVGRFAGRISIGIPLDDDVLRELDVRKLAAYRYTGDLDSGLESGMGESSSLLSQDTFKKALPTVSHVVYQSERNDGFRGVGPWEYMGGRYNPVTRKIEFTTHVTGNYTAMAYDKTFDDLAGNWAGDDIEVLAAHHVVKGVSDNTFAPLEKTSRAQFTVMLVRALGLERYTGDTVIDFKDVRGDEWYSEYIIAAAAAGLANGYGDGTFRPRDEITRQEMAVMVARALLMAGKGKAFTPEEVEEVLDRFKDGKEITSWAAKEMAVAVDAHVIRGLPGGIFAPAEGATRAESASVIKRLMEYTGRIPGSPDYRV